MNINYDKLDALRSYLAELGSMNETLQEEKVSN